MAVFTAIGVSVATGLAAVGAAATIYGVSQQQKAISSQRQAAQTQATMQREQASRQRRSAIRQSIAARAQLQAAAQVRGLGETSALAGGLGSISSQLGANLGFGSMMSGLGEQYSQLSMAAVQKQGQAALYGSIADIGFGLGQRLTPAQKPTQ